MNTNVDLNRYKEFVASVTSKESNDLDSLITRLKSLQTENEEVNISLLLTAAMGLGSESGEFIEIVKKIVFQGKPLTEENRKHMMLEISDIAWYWVNACRAINVEPNSVISANVSKLINRYPTGNFDVYYSENRKDGDL